VFSVAGPVPWLTIELDVSDAEAAQLLTVFGLTCAIVLCARLLPIGLVMLAVGNGLSVFAGDFFLLLAVRIELGIGAACVVRAGGRGMAGGVGFGTALGGPWPP
jgi:predicted MFS family arabinose efflux permease